MCASRAPLAERSAVNRQVLGSIPSGGASSFALFFYFPCPRTAGLLVTRGGCKVHTGGSSAVEQRTVKCASAYAVILWSGVQISPPGCFCLLFFFLCPQNHAGFGAFQTDDALRSHDSSVHSTRVVFIPSKDKIRVRVPMDAHGGLLYMVAYNLRKVENRDRYPDPPYAVAPK